MQNLVALRPGTRGLQNFASSVQKSDCIELFLHSGCVLPPMDFLAGTQLSNMPPKLRPGMLVYAKYGVVTSDCPGQHVYRSAANRLPWLFDLPVSC